MSLVYARPVAIGIRALDSTLQPGAVRAADNGVRYQLMRARETWRLRRAGAIPWDPATARSQYLTSVVRVPEEIADRMRAAVAGAGPHYLYPATDVHVTILNLDRFGVERLPEVEKALADGLRAVGPHLTLRGLTASRHSVFAPVYGELKPLRTLLARALGDPREQRGEGFGNVLRFLTGDVAAARRAANLHRRAVFGAFPVTEIQIVRTDKVLSAANTVVLGVSRR